ncbi:MAG: tetratricopeptide repeat protein [Pseudomonadota bacterium]|nr:tetratricopeptide repeat protein [Pseudomonadota bacterium]
MTRYVSLRAALVLWLATGSVQVQADALSEPPERWQGTLVPVAEVDISGAERLMQQAIAEARAEIAGLLESPNADPASLAGAYGRLGALFLLVDVEAQGDACFRTAGELEPKEFRWPYYAGHLAMVAGNTEQALTYLESARELDPEYPTLYLRLGKVQLDRGELAEARAALEKIADTPGLIAAANYYLGQIANLERRFEDAVARLKKALEADPNATGVHYPLAQAYRALGKNELAREHLGRFEAKSPEAEDPLLEQLQEASRRSLPAFHKGIHAIRQGKYATAAERFAEGLAVDPDNVPARVSYARALYLSGRAEEAGEELARALAANPNELLANFLQGVLLQQQAKPDRAADYYRRSLSVDPGYAGALFYLANLDFNAGRYREAAAGYAKALAADREIAPARLLELIARLRAGEPEADIAKRLTDLSAQYPEDPMLRYAMSRLLAAAADSSLRAPEQALQIASQLTLLQPIPPHQRALALAQAATGRFEEAAQTQRQAIAMAAWMAPPGERAVMQAELDAYERGELPEPAWPEGAPLLSPPPFDPVAPFRDYPAAVPY